MKWSKEQQKDHEQYHEKSRQNLVEGKHTVTHLDKIVENGNRGIMLIKKISDIPEVSRNISLIMMEICSNNPGFYFQEIPHFTLDCHRFKRQEEISPASQVVLRIAPASTQTIPLIGDLSKIELCDYTKVLEEEISKEPLYNIEIKGIGVGFDGLIAQVWYDEKRMIDFTSRLGERVRKEIPSMDFQWGIVKRKAPVRLINLTRFTGRENIEKVLEYANNNRTKEIGNFKMNSVNLLFSDHYLQTKNTLEFGTYYFAS